MWKVNFVFVAMVNQAQTSREEHNSAYEELKIELEKSEKKLKKSEERVQTMLEQGKKQQKMTDPNTASLLQTKIGKMGLIDFKKI